MGLWPTGHSLRPSRPRHSPACALGSGALGLRPTGPSRRVGQDCTEPGTATRPVPGPRPGNRSALPLTSSSAVQGTGLSGCQGRPGRVLCPAPRASNREPNRIENRGEVHGPRSDPGYVPVPVTGVGRGPGCQGRPGRGPGCRTRPGRGSSSRGPRRLEGRIENRSENRCGGCSSRWSWRVVGRRSRGVLPEASYGPSEALRFPLRVLGLPRASQGARGRSGACVAWRVGSLCLGGARRWRSRHFASVPRGGAVQGSPGTVC